jgi:hypothetical protein
MPFGAALTFDSETEASLRGLTAGVLISHFWYTIHNKDRFYRIFSLDGESGFKISPAGEILNPHPPF